jgi:hypothetical protein
MRWIIAVDQKRNAQAVAWCQTFAKGYDCSSVEWIRLDTGRHLPGRRPPQGVYGRCYYPSRDRRTFRVSCQVPGPFPHRLISKRQPLYEGRDPAWLSIPRGWESNGVGEAVRPDGTVVRWNSVFAYTRLATQAEGIIWIFGHEMFHFLRRSRQIPGRNGEWQADIFGDALLQAYREGLSPSETWS